jgi:outer membrane murein-binding lipoprotein Lpp
MRLITCAVALLLVQLSLAVKTAEKPVELLPIQDSNPIEDVDGMGNSQAAVTEQLFGGAPVTPLVNPQLTLYRVNGIISGDDTPSQQYLQPNNVPEAPVFSSYARNLGTDVDDGSMDVDPADVQRALRISGRAETNSLRVAKRVRIYQRRTKNRMDGMDRSNRKFRQRITARANGIDDRVSALKNAVDMFKGRTRSKFNTVDNQVQDLNRAVVGYAVVKDTVIRQGQKIDSSQVQVNGISSQVGALQATVSRARSRINNLVSQINAINSEAATKGKQTVTRIKALNDRIAQLQAASSSAAQVSYSKISSLQSKIRQMRLESIRYRQQVASSMQDLITNIKDLRASINSVKQSTAAAVARVRKMRGPQGPPGY